MTAAPWPDHLLTLEEWIIELGEPGTLTAHTLVDGDYEIVAQTTVVSLTEPAPVRVDLRELTSRR